MNRNKLYHKYYTRIKEWNWPAIVEEAKKKPVTDFEGNRYGYFLLGSVFNTIVHTGVMTFNPQWKN